jgi:signal recognition particle GTPase
MAVHHSEDHPLVGGVLICKLHHSNNNIKNLNECPSEPKTNHLAQKLFYIDQYSVSIRIFTSLSNNITQMQYLKLHFDLDDSEISQSYIQIDTPRKHFAPHKFLKKKKKIEQTIILGINCQCKTELVSITDNF